MRVISPFSTLGFYLLTRLADKDTVQTEKEQKREADKASAKAERLRQLEVRCKEKEIKRTTDATEKVLKEEAALKEKAEKKAKKEEEKAAKKKAKEDEKAVKKSKKEETTQAKKEAFDSLKASMVGFPDDFLKLHPQVQVKGGDSTDDMRRRLFGLITANPEQHLARFADLAAPEIHTLLRTASADFFADCNVPQSSNRHCTQHCRNSQAIG